MAVKTEDNSTLLARNRGVHPMKRSRGLVDNGIDTPCCCPTRHDRILTEHAAWGLVRRNGGAAGVDGERSRMSRRTEWSAGLGNCRGIWRGHLRAESGAAGAHSEKQPGKFPSLGHSMPEGSGCADVGNAGAVADLRGGPGAGAVRIPAGTKRQGRGQAEPPVARRCGLGRCSPYTA